MKIELKVDDITVFDSGALPSVKESWYIFSIKLLEDKWSIYIDDPVCTFAGRNDDSSKTNCFSKVNKAFYSLPKELKESFWQSLEIDYKKDKDFQIQKLISCLNQYTNNPLRSFICQLLMCRRKVNLIELEYVH